MGEPALQPFISVEDYLSGEPLSDVKHEYVDGEVYAMAGASRAHGQVALRLASALQARCDSGPCSTYIGDMKARLMISGQDIFYYPDIIVTCDRRDTDDYFLRFPKLIVEVLSPSTERLDRQEKFTHYRTIPTLEEYVLVSQERPEVTVFRQRSGWVAEVTAGLEAILHLESVDFHLPLSVLYQKVRGISSEG
jgi:Uma2 family endonuclease